jgi:hypothetical protein
MSSKTQKVLRPFVNRVTDWMAEQGIPIPNPDLLTAGKTLRLLPKMGAIRSGYTRRG